MNDPFLLPKPLRQETYLDEESLDSWLLCGVPGAMHLRDYSSLFQPEEYEALTAAFDAAWRHLWSQRSIPTPDQAPIIQKKLAQIILASAFNGKRDVEQLKEIALRGLSGQSRVSI